MRRHYVLAPGTVISKTDGQCHHISADQLARLYGVRREACYVWTPESRGRPPSRDLRWLRPRYDGDYRLPPPRLIVDSAAWTGRGHYWPDPMERLLGAIHAALWPGFACADCIGMIQHGCECAYHEAVAPGTPPGPVRRFCRRVFNYLVKR